MKALLFLIIFCIFLSLFLGGGYGGFRYFRQKRKEKLLKTIEGRQAVTIIERVKGDFKILPEKNKIMRATLIDMHLDDLQEVKMNFAKPDIKLMTGDDIDALILQTAGYKEKDQNEEIFFPPAKTE